MKNTSHILFMRFLFFYYVRRSVVFKIHAANIEASKFFVFVFVGDHGKLFLKISQMQSSMYMLLLQLSYISQRVE